MAHDDFEFRLLVTGSRDWPTDEWTTIWDALDRVRTRWERCPRFVLMHGGAGGVDSIANDWGDSRKYVEVRVFQPDYRAHGSAAPHVRNDAMLRLADHVVAFWDGQSRGTKSVIDKAIRDDVRYEVFTPEGVEIA